MLRSSGAATALACEPRLPPERPSHQSPMTSGWRGGLRRRSGRARTAREAGARAAGESAVVLGPAVEPARGGNERSPSARCAASDRHRTSLEADGLTLADDHLGSLIAHGDAAGPCRTRAPATCAARLRRPRPRATASPRRCARGSTIRAKSPRCHRARRPPSDRSLSARPPARALRRGARARRRTASSWR